MGNDSGQVEVSATSKFGDLSEAINLAVAQAKEELTTDFIRWDMISLSGEYGGITTQRHLTIKISAKGPA